MMLPETVCETVTAVRLPNYREDSDISVLCFRAMKRFHDQVDFTPVLRPVHHKDTIVCYKNCTKKRFISRTYYEPRVKPKIFTETHVIYPKRPERTFVTLLDYHIDECKKWFKTTLEFKARTFTTNKIMKDSAYESDLDVLSDTELEEGVTSEKDSQITEPGASQVFLPRFEKQSTGSDDFAYIEESIVVNGDIEYDC